jgi:hypothetical protein
LFLFFSSRPKKGEFEKKTHENSSLFFLSVARVSKISSNPFYTRIDLSLSLSLSRKEREETFSKKERRRRRTLKKERKKERESEDGPLPPPVASRPRTRTRALILFSLSSFVLDGVVFSSSRSSLRIFIIKRGARTTTTRE